MSDTINGGADSPVGGNQPETVAPAAGTNSPTGATANHPVTSVPTTSPVEVKISGAFEARFTGTSGQKLSEIVGNNAANFTFRSGSAAFGRDRVVTENVTLTATTKASGG